MQILVVDDEREIADLVGLVLTGEGYTVRKYTNPLDALTQIEHGEVYDLAVLDVMMPGMDGFALCARIREKYTYPIIMLTAKVEDMDKITGLSIGADDYITKPFNPLELLARVKAQLRRSTRYNTGAGTEQQVYDAGGLVINRQTHECRVFDREVALTPTEFKILWLLCENAGEVVSAERIFFEVWGEAYYDSNNTVMTHIRRLRDKLHEPPRHPRFIKTVWGVGYKVEKANH